MAIENAKFGKGIALAGGFDLGAKAPLDSRETVATIEERDAHVTGNRAYEGMLVFVEADKVTYQCLLDEEGNFIWKPFGFNQEDFESQVVDNLESEDSTKALSARQGKVLDGKIAQNTEDIAEILDEETGILKQAKDYADGKDTAIQAAQDAADKAQGEVDAVEERMAAAEQAIDAIEEDMGNVDDLQTANKTVAGAINEVLAAVGTGGTAAVVTVTTDTTTEGALKSYTIKQGTTTVGVIDIPKDMVVESGSVVVDPEGQEAGTYIKLVLANVAEPLYINVGKLVDIYTVEANATQVQLAIDPSTRVISATIVAGSITAAELAADAVTTVKIADGNVTKAKLSTEVQTSLAKADAAVPQATYDEKVAELEQADAGLEERLGAIEDKFGDGEGNVESQIASAVAAEKAEREAADEAVQKAAADDATEKANKALEDANAHADEEIAKDRLRLDELEKVDHEHANKEELDLIESGDKAKWDEAAEKAHEHENKAELDKVIEGDVARWNAAETNAKNHANDLNSAMDTRMQGAEGDIDSLQASLAEGGATANAIVEAKKAGTDAQTHSEGVASDLATEVEAREASDIRIETLEGLVGAGFSGATSAQIAGLFV